MPSVLPFSSRQTCDPVAGPGRLTQPAVRLIIAAGGRKVIARLRRADPVTPAPDRDPLTLLRAVLDLPH